VLERAAVVGRRLEVDDVAALLEPAAAPTLRAHLDALVGNGFLRPSPGGRFRFRHGLVHEAAYRGTPKTVRAELHERFADHLDRSAADDEVVGYHLEQAFVLRTELNAPDRLTRRLAEDAGRRLGRAGIRAWTSAEPARVAHLLQRATALLPPDDGPRRELLCELGVALHTAGNTDAADEAFESAATAARRAGDRRVALRAELELTAAHLLDSNGEPERLLAVADDALPVFESIEDERSLGRTWMLVGWVNGGMYCRNETWRACATRALAHYRRAGFPTSTCIGHIAASSYFGPMAAREATERSLELLQSDVDDRAAEATVLAHLGGLEAMLGRFDDAFAHLAVARATYQDLLRPTAVVRTCAPIEAQSARLWGDPERASAILTESCTTLREMQNWSPLSTQAAALADALCALDRHDEALEWLEAGESCATSDDIDAQLALGAVRATILLQQGAHDEAEDTARAAVALGERTDASNRRATTLVALARVLIGVDRVDEAAGVLGQARALYEEKGNAAAVALLEATAAA
jgi:tetratricopeptide (TPR) repeat protein